MIGVFVAIVLAFEAAFIAGSALLGVILLVTGFVVAFVNAIA